MPIFLSATEIVNIAEKLPQNDMTQLIITIVLATTIVTAILRLAESILGRSKKAIHHIVDKVTNDESFLDIKKAVATLPMITEQLGTITNKISSLTERVDNIDKVHSQTLIRILHTELSQLYYDMIKCQKINHGQWQSFIQNYDLYHKMGGNGVVKEYYNILSQKYENEMIGNSYSGEHK